MTIPSGRLVARLAATAAVAVLVLSCADQLPSDLAVAGVSADSSGGDLALARHLRLASITVAPNTDTLSAGGTQSFTAVGRDRYGRAVAISPTWTVVGGGGTITGAGLFTAGTAPGTFPNTIQASSGGISAQATVTVLPGTVASITVSPSPDTLRVGGTQQFAAVGRDAAGNTVPITATWSMAAGGGTITTAGLFTAGGVPGTYANTIQASSRGISATATITVLAGSVAAITLTPDPDTLPIGGAQQFTAVGRDAAGNGVAITPTWSVVAGGGTITGAGLFTAGAVPGTFANTVKATSGGVAGLATVTVVVGSVVTITVAPSPDTARVSGTQQFTAVGRDAGGNAVPITPTWSVVAAGGTITSAGLFTAGALPGTFVNTVKATSGGISGLATVTVLAGSLATVGVAPSPDTIRASGTQQFTAVGRDAAGNVVPITPAWSVAAGGGTISSSGMFTAGAAPGTYANTVRATSGGMSGSATVTVQAGVLETVAVTPSPVTLQASGTQQFTAVGKDASGNVVPITPAWSVVAGGGTISSSGLFTAGTAPGTFANTVKATSGSVSGLATVTVLTGSLTDEPQPTGVTFADLGTATLLDATHGISENFDRYAGIINMQVKAGDACGAGSDGSGIADAQTTYGNHSAGALGSASTCSLKTDGGTQVYSLITGRSGSGKAFRTYVHADPSHTQSNGTRGVGIPTNGKVFPTYTAGMTIVVQGWTRGRAGQLYQAKFFSLWYRENQSERTELGTNGSPQSFRWNPGITGVEIGAQPVGPYPADLDDSTVWHRITLLWRPNTTYANGGTSSRDGRAAAWIDGTKVVDVQQANVGVTPPGGTKVWCTQNDVDQITAYNIAYIFPITYINGANSAFNWDWDDIEVWVTP